LGVVNKSVVVAETVYEKVNWLPIIWFNVQSSVTFLPCVEIPSCKYKENCNDIVQLCAVGKRLTLCSWQKCFGNNFVFYFWKCI